MNMYRLVKKFGGQKVWRIGTQNMFGGENRLSICAEGNQGETEKLADKTLANQSSFAKVFFTAKVFTTVYGIRLLLNPTMKLKIFMHDHCITRIL